jgi:nucleoside triphosphate diphosphatase
VSATRQASAIARLLAIMQRLRAPDGGCPWDLQQDFRSIAPYTLEEAYEVVDSIETGHPESLKDELGDLLFQVVFHAQLASEEGWFGFDHVVQAICDKMERRHPHVFADAVVNSAETQTLEWERHKQQERGEQGSLLTGVPVALPALVRAGKLQQRAARAGFDWPDIGGVFDKVEEELGELREALASRDNKAAVQEEAGDLLFAVVNLLRHAGVDAESALREGNRKFERRFRAVEQLCAANNHDITGAGIEVLESYWNTVKAAATKDPTG